MTNLLGLKDEITTPSYSERKKKIRFETRSKKARSGSHV